MPEQLQRHQLNSIRQSSRGFSLLETQVAFVVFGIFLAGLFPLVVVQLQHVNKLEDRLSTRSVYYLVPASQLWLRKLGAAASIETEKLSVSDSLKPAPSASSLRITDVETSMTNETVTVQVAVIREVPGDESDGSLESGKGKSKRK